MSTMWQGKPKNAKPNPGESQLEHEFVVFFEEKVCFCYWCVSVHVCVVSFSRLHFKHAEWLS